MSKAKKVAATAEGTENKTAGKLERHEFSKRYSQASSTADRESMDESIRTGGQLQEIVLFQGQVLIGWGRYESCLRVGRTPRFREFTGDEEAARMAAAESNTVGKDRTPIQNAMVAAKLYADLKARNARNAQQKDLAKRNKASVQTVNWLFQLMCSDNPNAKKSLETIENNPDVTRNTLRTMMVDCGLASLVEAEPSAPVAPKKVQASGSLSDMLGSGDDDDDDDDVTGGLEIDGMIARKSAERDAEEDKDIEDDEPDEDEDRTGRNSSGGKVIQMPRGKIGHDKRAHETPASSAAQKFKGLTALERTDFIKFAWATLRPAIEQALLEGAIEWKNSPFGEIQVDANRGAGLANLLAPSKKSKAKPAEEPAEPKAAAKGKPAKAPATKVEKAASAAIAKAKAKPAATPAKAKAKPAPAKARKAA